jgi:hypothetical protein
LNPETHYLHQPTDQAAPRGKAAFMYGHHNMLIFLSFHGFGLPKDGCHCITGETSSRQTKAKVKTNLEGTQNNNNILPGQLHELIPNCLKL